jgi:tripartite-type tricarboxylate transporter receptor subunit TctC
MSARQSGYRKKEQTIPILARKQLKIAVIRFLFLMLIVNLPTLGHSQEADIANYPARPINFFISMPPGNSSDLAARLIAKGAERYLKQPIVPVNKPGGSLTVGVAAVATGKPDGYSIGISIHSPLFVVPHLEKIPYHPIKDLRQIMQFADFNFGVIVKSDSPFKEFKDIVAYGRQNPKKLTYGAATHAMAHLIMEQIAKKEKVQFTQIPYRATGEQEMALLGGHIMVGVGDFSYSLIEAGQSRLMLLFREERSDEYPQAPILKDLGYEIPCATFMGVHCPRGTPDPIIKRLEEAFTLAMKDPAFIRGMKELHVPIFYRSGKELEEYVVHNYEAFGKSIKEVGFTN